MPKGEKGILGYRKTPGKEILFSFVPRKGNECASDEEDSDYEPSDEERDEQSVIKSKSASKLITSKFKGDSKQGKKRTRKSKQKEKIMKRRRNMVSDLSPPASSSKGFQPAAENGHQFWGQLLPIEILVRVFEVVVQEKGAVPFLCRVSRVCHLWREAASKPSLWQRIDLSFGWVKSIAHTLNILLENRLSRLKVLNLSMSAKLTDKEIKLIVEKCQLLESINLTGCIKLTPASFKLLSTKCQHLKALNLSKLTSSILTPVLLKYMVETFNSRLEEFIITTSQLRGFQSVLKSLMTCCKNLRLLDLSNCKFSSDFLMIPIEEFQDGCPNLEILRLTGSKVRANQVSKREESLGFPKLKEVSVAVNITTTLSISLGITDEFLLRLLKTSSKLKHLDLRGCTHITADVLQKLLLDALEELFISQCSVSKYEGIAVIVQKWMHSLIELDLSWNVFPGMSLDIAMKKLSSTPQQSSLRILNLSGTSITAHRVKSLLEGCPRLSSLDLTSCRGLPRGMKQEYEGERLVSLKENIDSVIEEDEPGS
ncbi:F-box/LRR-repeat protein 6-like isoform X2 [Antedon mediterranea]|uniref:F-box/LRR-repeat protein 6-like isoform X2 n=1 Tax=Antedon mediterranea TaxID=105859 RepID=UPI003AF57A6E